jgi:23S rRNA pseudouridine1911/1915/1917 synthase
VARLVVAPGEEGERIDRFLSERKDGLTRSRIKHLIEEGGVLVGGRPVRASYRVREGDRIEVSVPAPPLEELVPEDIPVEILFADDDVVVVNKPPGLVVYPAAGHPTGTLMNALLYRVGSLAPVGGPLRPGVVHRLDRDTSGVMVVARSSRAYYDLVEQFRSRETTRSYRALVLGDMGEEGEIDMPIGRSEKDRKKMSTRSRQRREARTAWRALRSYGFATLLEVRLATGRTHQIRVHFASVGHPVLGDRVYGRKTSLDIRGERVFFPRQMLHAALLGFRHPATGGRVEFSAPVPADMREALERLDALARPD